MAVIYLAKKEGLPVGVFSTADLAKLISDDFEAVDVQMSPENTTLYYTNAVCPILTMTNGVPKSGDLILGPVISQSADNALSELYNICQKKRLSGILLNVFYCFEIDKNYGDEHSELDEPSVYKPWEYTNWNKAPNCANDPLIQAKWNALTSNSLFALDHLSLRDVLASLSINPKPVDLYSSFNSFSLNALIKKLVEMANNRDKIYILADRKDPNTFVKVEHDTIGYMCFFDNSAYDSIRKRCQRLCIARELDVKTLIESFVKNPEYGVYFVEVTNGSPVFYFVAKSLFDRASKAIPSCGEGKSIINDDFFDLLSAKKAMDFSPKRIPFVETSALWKTINK